MIRDEKTVKAILKMLDKRIERLTKDINDKIHEKRVMPSFFRDYSGVDLVMLRSRRREAELIRQTIVMGQF